MPSTTFGSGLTKLLIGASQGQENQNKKNNRQNQLIEKNAFHRFPLLETQQVGCPPSAGFYRLPGTKPIIVIIAAPSPAVNAKNRTIQNRGLISTPPAAASVSLTMAGQNAKLVFDATSTLVYNPDIN